VKIDGQRIKPSREIKIGEEIEIQSGILSRRVLVKASLSNRVSAKLVEEFMEDITPEEEIQKLKLMKEMNYEYRERGSGRPTKKDRRAIDGLKENESEEDD
jgi:ribosome-associated heat shock protein Hsp15